MNKSGGLPLALLFLLCIASPFSGQKSEPSKSNDRDGARQLERTKNSGEEVRQSFQRGRADGLKVTLYQVSVNGILPVNPRQAFKSGDRIKVMLQSNFDGYIYVVNLTPGGESRLLFPQGLSRRNNVRAGRTYDIPSSKEFQFDKEPGLEVLQILMSRSQVSFLEAILDRAPLKANNVPLDHAATKSLEKLTGKPTRLKASGIATETGAGRKSGLQTRMLTLDSRKEGSILVVSGTKGTPNRFQPGEIAVFEIRLNHY